MNKFEVKAKEIITKLGVLISPSEMKSLAEALEQTAEDHARRAAERIVNHLNYYELTKEKKINEAVNFACDRNIK